MTLAPARLRQAAKQCGVLAALCAVAVIGAGCASNDAANPPAAVQTTTTETATTKVQNDSNLPPAQKEMLMKQMREQAAGKAKTSQ